MNKTHLDLTLFSDGGVYEASGVTPQTPTENVGTAPSTAVTDSDESNVLSVTAANGSEDEMTYEQLIRSEKYREPHARHVRRIIRDRFKRLDRVDAELSRTREALSVAAGRLGLNTEGDDLAERVISFARDKDGSDKAPFSTALPASARALPHGADASNADTRGNSISEAHKHREADSSHSGHSAPERDVGAKSREEYAAEQVRALVKNGRSTKNQFPQFDLTEEMRDDGFVRLLLATGGDTTAAYVARHHGELLTGALAAAEARGMSAVESSLKRNRSRPVESPLSGKSTAIIKEDPQSLSLEDFRRIRDDYRRTGKRASF